MTFFKNNNTWLWVIVFIVLIIVVFGMKKSENFSSDCNVCGGFCTCPSCRAPGMDLLDKAYTNSNIEHFTNTVDNQMDAMHTEMNLMDKQMNSMNEEMNAKKLVMNNMPTQKSHMNTVEGHTNNIHHVTAAKVTECNEDEIAIPTHKLNVGLGGLQYHSQYEPMVQRHSQHEPMHVNRLHEMAMQLSHKAPEILNKCTPGLLQSLMGIAKLIGSTEGKVNKLKTVESALTREFSNLNMILERLDKKDMMCLETETNVPLNKIMCNQLDRYDVVELQQHANDLDYVNEMLKSQKQNFRQMRDLFVVRLKDLVNQCDNKDPEKRRLQLHSINTISEILHSLGYIFQDDTLESQEKMLKSTDKVEHYPLNGNGNIFNSRYYNM